MTAKLAFEGVWAAWAIIWILAAPLTARTVSRQPYVQRLFHVAPLVVGGWFLAAPLPSGTTLGHALFAERVWTTWLWLAITVAGIAFAVWARVALGRLWSGQITLKADHALVQHGPYALSRNPIYTGLLFALLATALARNTAGAVLGFAVVTVGFVFKILQEERLLSGHFGAAFDDYRRRVRRLVPFVW